MLDADRPWTALELEEALETIHGPFKVADTAEAHTEYAADTLEEVSKYANTLHSKMSMAIAQSIVSPLDSLVGPTKNSTKAVNSLTNTATQLVSLNRRVEKLSG